MTNKSPPQKKVMLECDEKEEKIIELIRKMDFGEIKVIVQDGNPIRIEEIRKSIKL
jgi:hypothetical protein